MGILVNENLHNEQVRKSIYREIDALVSEQGIDASIAAGECVKQLTDIGSSYEEASRLLALRFFFEDDQIITVDAVRVGPLSKEADPIMAVEMESSVYADKIYFAIDVGNMETVTELVTDMGQRLLESDCSEQGIKAYFAQVANSVFNKVFQSDSEIQAKSQQLSAGILAIYKYTSYSKLEQYLIRFLQSFNNGHSKGGTDKQINKMINLIQRNYHENLKLDALADVFNYNSAYLGKLFKTATGEYFNTYLDKVRIEKAKELLDLGMKVYQVAEKVGYTNVDYFHSKFRKYEGGSPSAYRKKGDSQ